MPTGEAFEDALRLLDGIKAKEIGAHLSLTETRPVTDPAEVPNLITKDGKFHRHKTAFLRNLFLKRISSEEIYTELKNQLDRIRKTSLAVTSLSSHEHIHMMPAVLDTFIKLAKEYHIPSIRYPYNEPFIFPIRLNKIYKKTVSSYFEKGACKMLRNAKIARTGHFRGFLDSGRLTEDRLMKILKSLKNGVTELVCHPGFLGPEVLDRYNFHINCESELFALTGQVVKNLIKANDIKLITYGEFLHGK